MVSGVGRPAGQRQLGSKPAGLETVLINLVSSGGQMLKVSRCTRKVQLQELNQSSLLNRGNHIVRMSSSAVLDLSGTTNFLVWVPI